MRTKLKAGLATVIIFLSLPYYAGFFDNFDSKKLINNVTDAVLNTKPAVTDMLFAKGITKEGMPQNIVKDFAPKDSKIYVYLKLDNFDGTDEIKAEWVFELNGRWVSLGTNVWTPPKGSPDTYFCISGKDGKAWAVGEYKVEISVEKEIVFSKFFNVKDGENSSETVLVETSDATNQKTPVSSVPPANNAVQEIIPAQTPKEDKSPAKQSSEEDFSL